MLLQNIVNDIIDKLSNRTKPIKIYSILKEIYNIINEMIEIDDHYEKDGCEFFICARSPAAKLKLDDNTTYNMFVAKYYDEYADRCYAFKFDNNERSDSPTYCQFLIHAKHSQVPYLEIDDKTSNSKTIMNVLETCLDILKNKCLKNIEDASNQKQTYLSRIESIKKELQCL